MIHKKLICALMVCGITMSGTALAREALDKNPTSQLEDRRRTTEASEKTAKLLEELLLESKKTNELLEALVEETKRAAVRR